MLLIFQLLTEEVNRQVERERALQKRFSELKLELDAHQLTEKLTAVESMT